MKSQRKIDKLEKSFRCVFNNEWILLKKGWKRGYQGNENFIMELEITSEVKKRTHLFLMEDLVLSILQRDLSWGHRQEYQ